MTTNETLRQECTRDTISAFEELKKSTKTCGKGPVREQGITKIQEIHSQEDKRDPEWTKRFTQGPLSRRRSRRMNLDETHRAPSLFTWRC